MCLISLNKKGALGATMITAVIVVIALLAMLPLQTFAATTSSRIAGEDRIATASAIGNAFGSAETVILAPADDANLVDSLTVAPLAGKVSPIYITYKNSLDAGVKAKLTGKNVYVIGAISGAVFAEVQTVANSATKLSGADRLATNAAINGRLSGVAGTFVVGYNAVPDALSIASYAAANNYAIVLANPDGTVDTDKILGSNTYVVGGPTLVKEIAGATRLSGMDRFATNTAVINNLSLSFSTVYLANGLSLVDALAGSSLAALTNSPIILSNNNTVTTAFNSKLASDGKVIALGGTGAVPDSVLAKVTYKSAEPASEITGYELTNSTGTEFVQTSNILVVTETAYFSKITATTEGNEEIITDTSSFSIQSSDPGVLHVDPDSDINQITAETEGIATITITYGNLTKQVTLRVVNNERELTAVRFKDMVTDTVITSLKTIIPTDTAKATDILVEPIDQYGDKMPAEFYDATSSNDSIMTISDNGDGEITVTGVVAGKAAVIIHDSDDNRIGSLGVNVSDNSEIASESFGIHLPVNNSECEDLVSGTDLTDFSADSTVDISGDSYVVYRLSQYNSDGIYLGADTTITIDLVKSSSDVADYTETDNGDIVVEGLKAGAASLVVKDDESGKSYIAKITVIDEGYSIESVNFKSVTSPASPRNYNYKLVLNYTETGNDPIIKGVTLYKPVSQDIRLQTSDGQLYIDKDGDGQYDSSVDTDLGYLEITISGDFAESPGPDVAEGFNVSQGDSGTVYFKIISPAGKIVASTYINVDL
ncbi:MAG TPA: cell wall-binding repeat-containing protein [Desulfitobacteriaceae bacterium]|nr:cell wall-binding repeat-containing protein [Desulfitobacteriaceae bacterium]